MKRIVITGLGVISSLGIGWKPFWASLIAGKSGISPITAFDATGFASGLGGQVKDFKPEAFLTQDAIATMGKASQFAVSAAKLAIHDAKLQNEDYVCDRKGVGVGTTNGETEILDSIAHSFYGGNEDALNPRLISNCLNHSIGLHIAKECSFGGPNAVIPTACAAGNYAVAYAYNMLCFDKADVMLAGGVDAFSWLAFVGFNRLSAVAPEKCQPFDKNRKGIITAEGAGMLVLETYENAVKRNAPIYCELLGYGLSCDAFHMTTPSHEGLVRVIESALGHARVAKEKVDYINAHGTGTPANDKTESAAIKTVFNDTPIAVSSIKSMLGHSMGAASALEAISTALTVKHDVIPPTINYETPDPECAIDCVPNQARQQTVNIGLNNSFAFGGNNSCLVLGKIKS
jgi:3-oxoacyl-[acyl-carrier-protein] synthase II